MRPDLDVDFANLNNMYGNIVGGRRLGQNLHGEIGGSRLGHSAVDEEFTEAKQRSFEEITKARQWHYKEGRLLHQSKFHAVYENDLGGDVRVVTSLILAQHD
jgi:hypothetical protein